jgi:hypothetical protein
MKNLSYLLLSFTILITVVIAIIIKPSNLDIFSFFLALTWLVFIVFINWLVSFYFFSNTKQNSSKFGILPSLHLVVFLYSIFTVVTLFYFWNHYNFGILPKLHWLIQVIGFGICGIIAILILIASKTSEISSPIDVIPKEELLNKLKILISLIQKQNSEIYLVLKDLESYIKFSLPHPTVIKDIENYKVLTKKIMAITDRELEEKNSVDIIKKLLSIAKTC